LAKKDRIFTDLKAICSSAKHAMELQVPVWSFSHVYDYPSRGTNPERSHEIDESGWREQVAFHGAASMRPLISAPIWTIMKKTNFCDQLAVRFGPNFTISTSPRDAVEMTDSTGETYYRHTVYLMLNYFPNGLPAYHQETRKKFEERVLHARRTLLSGQKIVVWRSAELGYETVYGPLSLVGPPAPLPTYSYPVCYCGCAHDDDAESEE
jgi:hypothetical protein